MTLRTITISGSYRKFIDLLRQSFSAFKDNHVVVLSPPSPNVVDALDDFVALEGDLCEHLRWLPHNNVSELMRLVENKHLRAIQQSDALWINTANQYLGNATAFEIGWAVANNIPVFAYSSAIGDTRKEPIFRAYVTSVKSIEYLVAHFASISRKEVLPAQGVYLVQKTIERARHRNHPLVAVGVIPVDHSKDYCAEKERDILVVETYKWGGRISIVGGRINKGQNLSQARAEKLRQQTGIEGYSGKLVCVFNELPNGGYYEPEIERIFIDETIIVINKKIELNEDASKAIWAPPDEILKNYDLEPNARKAIKEYLLHCTN